MNRPWSLQVSLVEGCSRLCSFCGLNGTRSGPGDYKFVSRETIVATAEGWRELNPVGRVEFAMHGEPTMHPSFFEFVALFRERLPKANMQLTTNGVRCLGKKSMAKELNKIFNAGIDFVVLDTYYPERDLLRDKAFALDDSFTVWDFYDDCVPKGWSPWHNHHRKHRRLVVLLDDLLVRNKEVKSRVIMNHAGNAPFEPIPDVPLRKTCTLPFREITVCHDGDVNICCMDWGHETVMGNVLETSLTDIWYGDRMMAARKVLGQKSREFTPCSRCNAGSGSRSGLLPKLGTPSAVDLRTLERAVYAGTATNKRRPWMSKKLLDLSISPDETLMELPVIQ